MSFKTKKRFQTRKLKIKFFVIFEKNWSYSVILRRDLTQDQSFKINTRVLLSFLG